MTTAAIGRDPFMPTPPPGRGPAFTLAVLAHLLLVAAIAFGVHWRRFEPTTMSAELWSSTPQAAAPREVEPPTPPPPPRPVVKAAEPVAPPQPKAPPQPDPQIAIEKAKREEVRRQKADEAEQAKIEQGRRDQLKRERLDRDQAAKKSEADRKAKEKAEAAKEKEKEQAEAAKLAAVRDAQLKRMAGMAGATGAATDTGSAKQSSGPSASYAGRIMARVKPNIVFPESIDGNPIATVEVKLAPDGTIVAKRLIESSGIKSWDDAVLRAIDRTEVLPRDVDGSVPPPFPIRFRYER